MADELKGNENILIKADEQNILYLDPNSLINDGKVTQRLVQHEQLVMYVNLEADIVPRSRVYLGGDTSQTKTNIVSLYRGNINFMKPSNSDVFDTSWTDIYSATSDKKNAMYASKGSQNFGIRNISIKQTTAMTPQVSITFIDVRGKTLFESPADSPYKAFFHLPYPIFYLTVKGYYGKAIRYRLKLKSFNARFDSETGNYEVLCDFLAPIAPLLSDIPVQYILAAPYMYPQITAMVDKSKSTGGNTDETSTKTVATSRGFEILKQVYDEYKSNGIIPKDFPYITLRDLAIRTENIDRLLEKKFFDDIIDPSILTDMDLFASDLTDFTTILGADGRKYLNLASESPTNKGFYPLAKQFQNSATEVKGIFDNTVSTFTKKLENNNAFGVKRTVVNYKKLTPPPEIPINIPNTYYQVINNIPHLSLDVIYARINTIQRAYITNRLPVEQQLNDNINTILRSKSGIGFEPTTRNVFAVIMAGADTFIRLINDVHEKAIKVAEERKKLISDTVENIYPFPQITKLGTDKHNILVYPGDVSVRDKLKAYDTRLWPEVEFVEQYYQAALQFIDPLINQETHLNDVTTIYPSDDAKNIIYSEIGTWNYEKQTPYVSKTAVSVFYELYERSYLASVYSGIENFAAIRQLAHIEANNVRESVQGVTEVEQKLKANRDLQTLKNELFRLSPFKRWENTKDEIFTTNYLRPVQEFDYELHEISDKTQLDASKFADYTEVASELQQSKGEFVKNLYPIVTKSFIEQLDGKSSGSTLNNTDFSVSGILKIDNTHGLIANDLTTDNWYFGEKENIFKDSNLYMSGTSMNILNTPYFTNALQKDITDGSYKRTAYLFLNSLPLVNLYNKFAGTDKYVFSSFNQYAAVHTLPYLWVLKMGSIWNRYKNTDILNVFDNNNIEELFDGAINNTLNLTINGKVKAVAGIDNNIGFYPKYFDTFYKGLHGGEPYFGFTGTTQSEYETIIQSKLTSQKLLVDEPKTNSPHIDYFTAYAHLADDTYFIFPSGGGVHLDDFTSIRKYQNLTTRIYFGDVNVAEYNFSGFTTPTTNQYFRTASTDEFSMSSDYKKTLDLLATFKPEILDLMETEFLNFAGTSTGNTTMVDILKQLCTITTTHSDKIVGFKIEQQAICEKISKDLMSRYYNLKISNPKEVNLKALDDYIQHRSIANLAIFNPSQVTSGATLSLHNIIGEDTDGYYTDFFVDGNLSFDEFNFRKYRTLVRYYAGARKKGVSNADFIIMVENLATSYRNKLNQFVTTAFEDLNKINLSNVKESNSTNFGFNDTQTLKLETYNSMKAFNDTWVGGNLIADKTIMNDFLFLDKANRDIGQKTYVNLFRVQDILNKNNESMSLFSLIGQLLQGAGFNFMALPAYVNFYGVNEIGDLSRPRYSTSQVASDLFGTFLEVDYLASSPKFVCQYIGLQSTHLNMNGISDDYKFRNDGVDNTSAVGNSLATPAEELSKAAFDKSNRVVCFEVNFGDQAQGIFKSLTLDQASIKNTAETYKILEDLAANESGTNAAQVDVGLFNVYRTRNYTCEVTMLGDVMIQPTMYFQLRNVPMFSGAYLILEVRHEISDNQIETTFVGTRISNIDLPDLKETMVSTNKIIYQRLLNFAKTLTRPT
jgi:hypothetical protein